MREKNIVKVMTLFIILGFVVVFSGCARFAAPAGKLKYDVYSPQQSVEGSGRYVVGVRDELEISIWRCPELDTTGIVRPEDGCVTVPLVGDVRAAGLTPKELADRISRKMAYYVKDPRVAVGVVKFGDKKVYILGQVLMPGMYKLAREDRMLDLISRAGGFNDNAIPSSTYIVRGGYDDPKIIRVNMGRLIFKGDTSQNVYLMEGDMIYVPVQEIENLNYALRKIFPSMYFAERLNELKQNIVTGGYDWHQVWNKISDAPGYTRQ